MQDQRPVQFVGECRTQARNAGCLLTKLDGIRIGLPLFKSLLRKPQKDHIASRTYLISLLETVLRMHQLMVFIRDAVQITVMFFIHQDNHGMLRVNVHLRDSADERHDCLGVQFAVCHADIADARCRAADFVAERNALKAVQEFLTKRLVVHALVVKNRQERVVLLLAHFGQRIFENLILIAFKRFTVAVLMYHDVGIQIRQTLVVKLAVISKVRQNGRFQNLVCVAALCVHVVFIQFRNPKLLLHALLIPLGVDEVLLPRADQHLAKCGKRFLQLELPVDSCKHQIADILILAKPLGQIRELNGGLSLKKIMPYGKCHGLHFKVSGLMQERRLRIDQRRCFGEQDRGAVSVVIHAAQLIQFELAVLRVTGIQLKKQKRRDKMSVLFAAENI